MEKTFKWNRFKKYFETQKNMGFGFSKPPEVSFSFHHLKKKVKLDEPSFVERTLVNSENKNFSLMFVQKILFDLPFIFKVKWNCLVFRVRPFSQQFKILFFLTSPFLLSSIK